MDKLLDVIYSLKMPETCQTLKQHKIICHIIPSLSLFKQQSIKIIIDLGDLNINSNSLTLIEQKIRGAVVAFYNLSVLSRLVFIGKNVKNIPINNNQTISLDGIFKPIEGIKKIIAVCSGKGGVGKSTVTSNLAVTLNSLGYKVGILDADIYGSSIPTIFGIENQKLSTDNAKLNPIIKYNIQLVSIGLLNDLEIPIIWRGPMLSKALHQMFRQTNWNDLDYLIVDTPPGTGDIHISLMQNYPLEGIITVSTNDRLSEINTNKTVTLFTGFGIPIISKINNMSDVVIEAQDNIPLNLAIHQANNIGTPFCYNNPNKLFINTLKNLQKP